MNSSEYTSVTEFDEDGNFIREYTDEKPITVRQTEVLKRPNTYPEPYTETYTTQDKPIQTTAPTKQSIVVVVQKNNKPLTQSQKDSLEFYKESRTSDPTGSLVTQIKAFPKLGYRTTEWLVNGRLLRNKTEFFKKKGVQSMHRKYYDNGRLESIVIYEEKIMHIQEWDSNGKIIREEYSIPIR